MLCDSIVLALPCWRAKYATCGCVLSRIQRTIKNLRFEKIRIRARVWRGLKFHFFSWSYHHYIPDFKVLRIFTFRGEHQSATKLVETLHPKGLSDGSLTSTKENKAFPAPSPPCSVLPLFELPTENNNTKDFEWRGGGSGVDSFVLCSYPIEYNNFVADWLFPFIVLQVVFKNVL